jgi:integrase/recombinase XerD
MSHLSEELDRYLTIRRSLGYNLKTTAVVLRSIIAFAAQQGADHISTDLFLRWQGSHGYAGRQTWATRLRIVRIFTQWLHGLDPLNEPPPRGLIPGRYRRSRPYIYSEREIERIVTAAAGLPSIAGIRALTYSTLFGLIAVTGIRISEALALNNDDVDTDVGVLTIRRGKFGKARLTPIENGVSNRLRAYASERDRRLGFAPRSFFVTDRGSRPSSSSARNNFATVCERIGLRPPQRLARQGRGPRIHDLRHAYAVRTIIGWYRAGQDPTREMIKLSTYLGHSNPGYTYWYIEAVPELLELASQRVCESPSGEVLP